MRPGVRLNHDNGGLLIFILRYLCKIIHHLKNSPCFLFSACEGGHDDRVKFARINFTLACSPLLSFMATSLQ